MNVRGRRVTWCAGMLGLAAVVAACQFGGGADKAGGDTVVLRLASVDDVNDNGQSYGPQAFIDSLEKRSGGRLQVKVETPYGTGLAEDESKLVKAIASGKVDGGWPASRAFASAGIHGLEAIEAPMTISSFAAEKAVVTAPVAGRLLSTLDGSGVVGLGLAVGSLRRPFAVGSPLLGPADWKGATFRSYNSPVQTDAIRALDATPVNLGMDWIDAAHSGQLTGLEFDIPQAAKNDEATQAPNVTSNIVLWPKVLVLSISQKRFDTLTAQQQGWVRQAGRDAAAAAVAARYDETTPARALCGRGVRFVRASSAQVAATRASLQPVLERLAADPVNGPLLRDIQAAAAMYPDPVTPDVPPECRQPVAAAQSTPSVPRQVSTLPDGIYRDAVTEADVAAAGLSNNAGVSGIWTLIVRHGTYQVRCRVLTSHSHDCGNMDSDEPLEVGDLRGTGTTVWFVPDAERLSRLVGCTLPPSAELADHCGPDDPYHAAWSVRAATLTFSDTSARGLSIKPWTRIA